MIRTTYGKLIATKLNSAACFGPSSFVAKQAFTAQLFAVYPLLLLHFYPRLICEKMSDLCPVYAPFFGAMVSMKQHDGNVLERANVSMVHIGLHKRYRVHLCVSLHNFWVLNRCELNGHVLNRWLGIGARYVLVALLSRLKSLTSVPSASFTVVFFLPHLLDALHYTFRSYGTAKSGVGISAMSVLRPDLMMKCCIPIIMAGIIAVRV
jgi:hypothetical protein